MRTGLAGAMRKSLRRQRQAWLFSSISSRKNKTKQQQHNTSGPFKSTPTEEPHTFYIHQESCWGPKIPVLIIADGEKGTEAIIIAHTSCLVPPRKGKRLMIFLVQAIKKLFVTCQAVYDVRDLGKRPQRNSVYAGKKQHSHTMPAALWRATAGWQGVGGERERKKEEKKGKKATWKAGKARGKLSENEVRMEETVLWSEGTELGKRLIYLDRLTPGQTAAQTAHCHQKVM